MIIELGRYLTESSTFTIWYVREVKASDRDDRDVASLLSRRGRPTRLIYEAWREIETLLAAQEPPVDIGERMAANKARLASAVRAATAELVELERQWTESADARE